MAVSPRAASLCAQCHQTGAISATTAAATEAVEADRAIAAEAALRTAVAQELQQTATTAAAAAQGCSNAFPPAPPAACTTRALRSQTSPPARRTAPSQRKPTCLSTPGFSGRCSSCFLATCSTEGSRCGSDFLGTASASGGRASSRVRRPPPPPACPPGCTAGGASRTAVDQAIFLVGPESTRFSVRCWWWWNDCLAVNRFVSSVDKYPPAAACSAQLLLSFGSPITTTSMA